MTRVTWNSGQGHLGPRWGKKPSNRGLLELAALLVCSLARGASHAALVPGIARYKGSIYQIVSEIHYKWYTEVNFLCHSESLTVLSDIFELSCVKGGQYCDCTILRTGTRESLSFSWNWVNYLSVSRVVNVVTAQHCARGTRTSFSCN